MKTENPFTIRTNFTPQKHFGRKKETEFILQILSEGENIFVVAPEGIEKNDLFENLLYQLNRQKTKTLHFDLENTSTLKEFLLQSNKLLSKNNSIKSDDMLADQSSEIVELISALKKKCVIVIGNVQFAETSLLNFLKTEIMELTLNNDKLSLIVSGSENLISANNFQSIVLNNITDLELQKYIIKTFKKEKTKIDKKVVKKIIDWSDSDSLTIKLICSRLWSLKKQKIKENDLVIVLKNILNEYERLFLQIKKLLSDYQWKLLRAIAVDKDAIQITSTNFIKKYELNAPSSVKTAVTALQEKGLIIKSDNTYKLTNVILSRWIEFHHLA